jgi:hypothetical protein
MKMLTSLKGLSTVCGYDEMKPHLLMIDDTNLLSALSPTKGLLLGVYCKQHNVYVELHRVLEGYDKPKPRKVMKNDRKSS